MSRFFSLFLISCLAYISPLSAQKGCCDTYFNQGNAAFKAKNYNEAIRLFNEGNDCGGKCTHDFMALIVQVKAKQESRKVIEEYLDSLISVPSRFDTLFFSTTVNAFIEPQMVKVEGGTFQMGSNHNIDEKPIHAVKVSDFSIGKYEVTQAEWRAVMGDDPEDLMYSKGDSVPVYDISWDDVQVFLEELNAKTGKKYRLPTEAEWEFAARGGNKSNNYTYSGSNDIQSVAWTFNGDGIIHPVGQKNANELGIYDMTGNVCEWCQDWYQGYPGNSVLNNQTETTRVARGGGWYTDVELRCSTTFRCCNMPTHREKDLGFRLALSSF